MPETKYVCPNIAQGFKNEPKWRSFAESGHTVGRANANNRIERITSKFRGKISMSQFNKALQISKFRIWLLGRPNFDCKLLH